MSDKNEIGCKTEKESETKILLGQEIERQENESSSISLKQSEPQLMTPSFSSSSHPTHEESTTLVTNGILHPTSSSVLVYTVSAGNPSTASVSHPSIISSTESSSTTTTSMTATTPTTKSPSSSSDEVFGDIDLSLYDFDLLSLPLSTPNVKMTPVSAEELMSDTVVIPDTSTTNQELKELQQHHLNTVKVSEQQQPLPQQSNSLTERIN
jgi:hypothetical protein